MLLASNGSGEGVTTAKQSEGLYTYPGIHDFGLGLGLGFGFAMAVLVLVLYIASICS